ncbi:hypothetical protein GJ496_010450 [Pomphorhynchus laevis]|nr:hypothetical protein GJ496_010450 [Pomphorhynchus laevis]
MINFETFCGSPLFENQTQNILKDLTICFKTTLLYWIPMLCYFILLPFWIKMLCDRNIPPKFLKPSPLYYFKLACSILLILICTILIIVGVIAKSRSTTEIPYTYFILWTLLIITMVSTIFVIRKERIKGKYSSMLLFLLFLSLVVASIPGLIDFYANENRIIYSLFITFFAILSVQLIVMLFPERHNYEKYNVNNNKLCPENYVGVMQKLYFAFVTNLIIKGYKRPLSNEDLWDLDENEKSNALCEKVQHQWNIQALKSINIKMQNNEESEMNDNIPSRLAFSEEVVDVRKSKFDSVHVKLRNFILRKKDKNPSLALALLRAFKGKILASAFLKLIYDLLQFTPPLVLRLILNFIDESDTKPLTTGIFFCFLMIVNSTIQSCILHQYFQRVMLIGQRFRTAIIAMIYKKSLRLSTASRQLSTVGEMVNLMSVDAQRLLELTSYMHIIWSGPLQIILAIVLLWDTLGASIIAGVALLVLAIPLNTWIGAKLKTFQTAHMKLKDVRVKDMNEILNGIKVIKLYAWETLFIDKVSETRKKELVLLRKTAWLNAIVSLIWTITPFLVSVVTFGVYIMVSSGNILTADKAFVSLTLFALLRFPLFMLATVLTNFVQAKVSIQRIENFLGLEELDPHAAEKRDLDKNAIEVKNGTFEWSKGETAISQINLDIQKGSLVAVVGDVGSGKSALLQSILGEMEKLSGHVHIDGKIAYVPQQAWILNTTVRENITMLKPFNEKLYDSVLEACALNADLKILPGGDHTEIGERGINLSGGQKQRISLARAIYSNADIYLMDDPLSAVDAHVSKHIFSKAIIGLLNKKTRVLVTNGLGFLPKCHSVVCLRKGNISEQGKFDDLITANGDFSALAKQYVQDMANDNDFDDNDSDAKDFLDQLSNEQKEILDIESIKQISKQKKEKMKFSRHAKKIVSSAYNRVKSFRKSVVEKNLKAMTLKSKVDDNINLDKLMTSEHIETTSIKNTIVLDYFRCYGRIVILSLPALFALTLVAHIGYNLWLSHWSSTAEADVNNTAKRDLNIGIYALLGCLHGVIYFSCNVALLVGAYRASVTFHDRLLNRCLRATMMFFDTTPIGRIINRFSKDIDIVDYSLPASLRSAISTFITILSTLVIITIANPIFLAIAFPIAILFYFLQRFYIRASRQLRRIESVTRSPIYSHFSESIQGLQCIRAANLSEAFTEKNHHLNDINITAYYPSILVNRWLAMILETLANIIVFATCIMAVTSKSKEISGLAGLSISNALGITQALNWVVRMISEIETNIVGVERVIEYCEIDSEPPWEAEDVHLDKDWPKDGVIDIKNYSLRYREGLDPALRDITMRIKSGEKVGLVGRTGAGKSSLTAGLFRLVETVDGHISIDNQIIQNLGLHQLRSKITVLPQDPVIFSGTLRSNLDPFNEYDDDKVWDALKNSNMDDFVSKLPSKLNYQITEAGENLSCGQRQLFCLTRALLRKSKILVLDEATAAVDMETDDIIQSTIRSEFKDCTIITIAHRINTIMDYDRIAVFDHGELKEFGTPNELLLQHDSDFSSLVKDANLKVDNDNNDQENT